MNWIGVTLTDAAGKTTCDGAFVTSLSVTQDTVAEIAACARGRVKDCTLYETDTSFALYYK